MATESGRLVALVTHARHMPSVERDRFGVGARALSDHHAGFVLEALIDSTAAEFLTWFAAHDRRATAQALAGRAERAVRELFGL